jgi:hypothetical protein
MAGDDPREQFRARGIQRRHRLVQDPQRPGQERKAREADAPALALREHARGERALAPERHGVERRADRRVRYRHFLSASSERRFSSAVSSSEVPAGGLRTNTPRRRNSEPWRSTESRPPIDNPAHAQGVVFPVPFAPVTTSSASPSDAERAREQPREAAARGEILRFQHRRLG